jgi:uncharacterized membrane protein
MAAIGIVDAPLLTPQERESAALLLEDEALSNVPRDSKGKPILTPAQQERKKQLDKAKSQRRTKALLALLWRSLLIAILVGLLAAGVYALTAWIAGGRISWRNILAASVGSAFLTFALTFSISAVQIFQQS